MSDTSWIDEIDYFMTTEAGHRVAAKAIAEANDLRARLADEQAKRIAAEKQVETWFSRCEAHRIAKEACEAKIADLERRLSTVPEDFGPLIDELLFCACTFSKDPTRSPKLEAYNAARAALAEKIAAALRGSST